MMIALSYCDEQRARQQVRHWLAGVERGLAHGEFFGDLLNQASELLAYLGEASRPKPRDLN
nr:MAG: hypothetical protein DIU78_20275 [Pseudomonadota bacterium]